MPHFFIINVLLVLIAFSSPACSLQVELENVAPVVTWVAVPEAHDGIVDVTVWVYDLEEAPVDLVVNWWLDGEEQGAIDHAPGSHGQLGLTTDGGDLGPEGRPDPDGQPHLIRWALPDDLPSEARLRLSFTADDLVSAVGPSVATPAEGFTASAGLEGVVALAPL